MIENECIEMGTSPSRGGKGGYGRRRRDGQVLSAHRLAYVEHHGLDLGDIEGMVIMHLCDNPPCVNPDHLRLGTHAENTADMYAKGRGWGFGLQAQERHPCHPCQCESRRHCSECGASLDGFRRQAVTCSGRCRIARLRRIRYIQDVNPLQEEVTR